jgi:rod shape-determining protein MreC
VHYAGKSTSRTSDSALATLPLLMYITLAVGLMVADNRVGYGQSVREKSALVTEPFWWLAASPVRLYEFVRESLTLRGQLQEQNRQQRHDLQVASARILRLKSVAEENVRLRELLGGARGYALNVRMAGIVGVDLDPFRQRLVLDAGGDEGVQVGQVLIDSGGVLGQVVEVGPGRAIALLLTDPDHAIPVQIARSGLRTVAYGTGESDRLVLPNISQSADILEGDVLITSGIGGRFPAGFPVGVITGLRADKLRLFVIADAKPAAHLERGNEVLLIHSMPPVIDAGPPSPQTSVKAPTKPPATEAAAEELH